MSEYVVTDTELTAVANAIRTKGGTSAQLEWNTDFISAINAISGGDDDSAIKFIYTKLGTRTISNNINCSSNGALFDSTTDYIDLSCIKNLNDITIELNIKNMNLTSGSHRRFVMGASDKGFIYRNTGVWAFYNGSWEDASFSDATDGAFFSNCNLKIYIDNNDKWHIYKNNVLIWEPNGAQTLTSPSIGSTASSQRNSIDNALIEYIKIYNGNASS